MSAITGQGSAEPAPPTEPRPDPWLAETDSSMSRLRYALPPIHDDGSPATWFRPPGRPAEDPARWRTPMVSPPAPPVPPHP